MFLIAIFETATLFMCKFKIGNLKTIIYGNLNRLQFFLHDLRRVLILAKDFAGAIGPNETPNSAIWVAIVCVKTLNQHMHTVIFKGGLSYSTLLFRMKNQKSMKNLTSRKLSLVALARTQWDRLI